MNDDSIRVAPRRRQEGCTPFVPEYMLRSRTDSSRTRLFLSRNPQISEDGSLLGKGISIEFLVSDEKIREPLVVFRFVPAGAGKQYRVPAFGRIEQLLSDREKEFLRSSQSRIHTAQGLTPRWRIWRSWENMRP